MQEVLSAIYESETLGKVSLMKCLLETSGGVMYGRHRIKKKGSLGEAAESILLI